MESIKKILPHVVSWFVLFTIVLLTSLNVSEDKDNESLLFIVENVPIWFVYIVFFYVNYLFIVPKLLFKRVRVLYTIAALLIFLTSFNVINSFRYEIYIDKINSRIVAVNESEDIHDKRKYRIVEDLEDKRRYLENRSNRFNIFAHRDSSTTYVLVIFLGFALGLRIKQRWVIKEAQLIDAKQRQVESELLYLKQQMNPHFLFNTLNSIYSLMLPHSFQASESILKLSSILRYLLYETDKDSVSLGKEVEIISDYIALQKLKYTDMTAVTFATTGNLHSYNIPPLILIPFIENAYKYGADNISESYINIMLSIESSGLMFSVENRVVIDCDTYEDGGIGINNVKRRLDLLFGDKYSFKVIHDSDIFSVSLFLPLNR